MRFLSWALIGKARKKLLRVMSETPPCWAPVREFHVSAHEGPVFLPPWAYYTTTAETYQRPSVRIERLNVDTGAVEVIREEISANVPNGMIGPFKKGDGSFELFTCEQGFQHPTHKAYPHNAKARISKTVLNVDGTHSYKVVFEETDTQPLNSPNDICVASDGAIWFTDPTYGSMQGFRPKPPKANEAIYRLHPETSKLSMVLDLGDDETNKPNGICFSPCDSYLYFTNTSAALPGKSFCRCRQRSVWRVQLNADKTGLDRDTLLKIADVDPPEAFSDETAIPDGLKYVDGFLITSCGKHIAMVDLGEDVLMGERVKHIHLPCVEEVTNFALSQDNRQMIVCGNNKLVLCKRVVRD
uniref:SMP-30/Gluconolactonase/LRE-like region domain-containing protein n=1 Tax=Chromera velia CCMP2878 TaxID=1169474 RepID=A0A0G4HT36_9ALVE|eukprot:Cvel_31268.t1-p1 / transcript=Cvel_31268.t1 / gene=Cvel_31268 / organism=Chromera_velia_CCMP2878 / gene_product=Gluconolactonase, putative / transcript_product=Gluconolactonase, putative / location=Cvel_scaffold4628:4079-5143(+) / protein_length=355 / sequence_SO=supercontig / SO=protein_coding / is_pseudo=false